MTRKTRRTKPNKYCSPTSNDMEIKDVDAGENSARNSRQLQGLIAKEQRNSILVDLIVLPVGDYLQWENNISFVVCLQFLIACA